MRSLSGKTGIFGRFLSGGAQGGVDYYAAMQNLDYLYFLLRPVELRYFPQPGLIANRSVDINADNTIKNFDSQLFQ
jgi:hypothetical protein